ncbi:MAG: zinc ABC transporter ATP-binding protein ZnuC [Geminicoccaceae bacterium]|nr:zinc ABC transporter ATP-binding protein ZnuC [Geminicoccaceae bacterium]
MHGLLIKASGVTMRAGGREILDRVDLEVGEREIVALIGPNGAGKTTLLKVLLTILRPDAGSVERRAGLTIGYVPQRLRLDPILPIDVRRLLRLAGGGEISKLDQALGEVGARHLLDASLHDLSGGEFQRVMLAHALIRRSDLLILDEPAQGIDLTGQLDLYGLIERIRDERGCGILLVSHDLHVVMSATDRVVCLNRHVCCSGRPETVSLHPAYVALFGRRGADRLAVYHHSHDHHHDLDGRIVEHDHRTSRPGA